MADAAMKHEASATAQGALCNQCLVFQLSKARFKASPFDERHMHQLGQFTDVLLRNHCPLCKFVTYCFQNGPIASEVLVGARIQGCWSEIVKGLPNACLTIFLVPRNEQGNIALNIRLLSDCNSPQAGMGRLLGIDFVDSSVIRNWTDNCHKYHQCSAPISSDGLDSNLPPGFILIDTLDMCLVEVDCPDRFLALSYVWGDSVKFKTTSVNVGMLKESNAIRKSWSQLSPTIRDAIMLTSSLNERYIWIDSLCILQDNSDNSQANITAMDSIYRRAHLVIIAADDRAMNEGLLGVTTPRAKAQQATELFPGLRVLGTFSYSTYMDISTYETRGWT